MVGRITSGSKPSATPERRLSNESLPLPYQEGNIPLLASARTTNTPTEAETTTNFFSRPLWRKRPPPPEAQRTISTKISRDGLAYPLRPHTVFELNKALPPTPPDMFDLAVQENTSSNTSKDIVPPHTSDMQSIHHGETITTPIAASALVQAGLGLGLPHVIPQVSSPSSSFEVNSISFVNPVTPLKDLRRPLPIIRKSKSSQRIESRDPSFSDDQKIGQRRNRGISFGASSFLGLGHDAKDKVREIKPDNQSAHPNSTATILRKPSFWSRRKSACSAENTPVTRTSSSPPPLPSMPPVSPFAVNYPMEGSSLAKEPPELTPSRARGLSRSHSERFNVLHSLSGAGSLSSGSTSGSVQRVRRPQTADILLGHPIAHDSLNALEVDSNYLSPTVTLPRVNIHFQHPQPKNSLVSARRPRAQTNPPLLHRLSFNVFSSADHSTSNSPVNSNYLSSIPSSIGIDPVRMSPIVPKPLVDEESPQNYLERLRTSIGKAEIAGILASSATPFYADALRAYIGHFNFVDNPLDIALRKLLMDVGLPRETQQIDRVMEAFAARYSQCNPNAFASEDHPYILAFSLIMLHTDAFNKSNKRKMTKTDYIKNTRLPGVAPEVLDCFYDNIVFAPFIFIEDPFEINSQKRPAPDVMVARSSPVLSTPQISTITIASPTVGRGGKVDPYYLITNNMLQSLRSDVETLVSWDNPFSYEGTAGPWDSDELRQAFARASILEVSAQGQRPTIFNLSVDPPTPSISHQFLEKPLSNGEMWSLKVTKVGLLNRKDDVLEGGKKASNRKWKTWSVVLTGSQLLFFRDHSWATSWLIPKDSQDGQVLLPQSTMFKPDELLSVRNAIAVFDQSYSKYINTLRFVMPDGRQILLQTSGEGELNKWISMINYASTFKSAGIRMRPLGLSGRDIQLTGVAAATSHLHDLQHLSRSSKVHTWDSDAPLELMGMLTGEPQSSTERLSFKQSKRRVTLMELNDRVDLDTPVAPEIEGADQFKATFDHVKAKLAAENFGSSVEELSKMDNSKLTVEPDVMSPLSLRTEGSPYPSRSQIITSKLQELDTRIKATQSQLDFDIRTIRYIAILTPFQRATRGRLLTSVQRMSKRVTQMRLDLAKFTCHHDILSKDLTSEDESWSEVKQAALQVAKETLQTRPFKSIPRTTLSLDENEEETLKSGLLTPRTSRSRRGDSSTSGSYHSALGFGPDCPSSSDLTSTIISASQLFDSSRPSTSGSLSSDLFVEGCPRSSQSAGPSRLPSIDSSSADTGFPGHNFELATHEKFVTAQEDLEDQAQAWNETRCAQRVSLVKVPSTIRMSLRFGSQGRDNIGF